jgi:tRNA (guanine-N7-)-methyltransferase
VGKNKLAHFKENVSFRHVFEPNTKDALCGKNKLIGNWSEFFGNGNPIILELGCGKGEYTIAMARMYPNKNFIGVDIKGARIWRGAKTIEEEQIKNAAFLRTKVEFIASIFSEDEISEIWLTFSDPQLKDNREKHRLTHPRFLDIYQKILVSGGLIHLKSDSRFLTDYTLSVLEKKKIKPEIIARDLYGIDWESFNENDKKHLAINTFHEQKFLEKGKLINYIRLSL